MTKLLGNKLVWLAAGAALVLLAIALAIIAGREAAEPQPAGDLLTRPIDLPAAADQPGQLTIQLREAGVDGPLLAEQILASPAPADQPLTISYDPGRLDQDKSYWVVVRLYDDDNQLVFSGNAPYPADSQPTPVEIAEFRQTVETGETPVGSQPAEPEVAGPAKPEPPAPEPDPAEPRRPQPGRTSVEIHFARDYNLPAGARLTVSLNRLGQPQGPAGGIIATAEITDPGPPPVKVELAYDPADAPPDNRYSVLAGIYRPDGKQLMTNSSFGFELKLSRIDGLDIHLVAIRPDRDKTPEELDAAVTGTIRYRQSCQLPAGSKLTIRLLGNVNIADAPTPIISETEIIDPGPSPVKFELRYDSSEIEARSAYSLSGRIEAPGGRLLFVTDTVYEVITGGRPDNINLPLVAAGDC